MRSSRSSRSSPRTGGSSLTSIPAASSWSRGGSLKGSGSTAMSPSTMARSGHSSRPASTGSRDARSRPGRCSARQSRSCIWRGCAASPDFSLRPAARRSRRLSPWRSPRFSGREAGSSLSASMPRSPWPPWHGRWPCPTERSRRRGIVPPGSAWRWRSGRGPSSARSERWPPFSAPAESRAGGCLWPHGPAPRARPATPPCRGACRSRL